MKKQGLRKVFSVLLLGMAWWVVAQRCPDPYEYQLLRDRLYQVEQMLWQLDDYYGGYRAMPPRAQREYERLWHERQNIMRRLRCQ